MWCGAGRWLKAIDAEVWASMALLPLARTSRLDFEQIWPASFLCSSSQTIPSPRMSPPAAGQVAYGTNSACAPPALAPCRKIEVKDFPAFIVVDDKGNDFFQAWQV